MGGWFRRIGSLLKKAAMATKLYLQVVGALEPFFRAPFDEDGSSALREREWLIDNAIMIQLTGP